jgi:hypothetical protein
MMAAGPRAGDGVTGRDLAGLEIARLDGFPTIISPVWRAGPARRNQRHHTHRAFDHNNIENYIVYNFERGYDPKKSADSMLYRRQHRGKRHEKRSQGFCRQ